MRDGASSFNNTLNSVQMDLYAGSIAVGNIIKGSSSDKYIGVLALLEGSKAYDTIVEDRGSLGVRKGAEAYNTIVKKGGVQVISDYAYAQANLIDGGEQQVSVTSPNGLVEDTIVINGGTQYIWNGTAKNSHISGAGSYQLASGKSIETKVYDGGTQRVQTGIADGTQVYGLQIVSSEEGY